MRPSLPRCLPRAAASLAAAGPRTKGRPLPTPQKTAQHCCSRQKATVNRRGKLLRRLVYAQQVLWDRVCPKQPILLVICRDPAGKEPDGSLKESVGNFRFG